MTACLTTDRLRDLFEERLPPDEQSEASSHLSECPACQQQAEKLTDDRTLRREYVECNVALMEASFEASSHSQRGSTQLTENPASAPAPAPRPPLPASPFGRYQPLEIIAKGSFGEVWRAYDPELKREVAIKTVRGDRDARGPYIQGFLDEGRKLAALRHRGIVDVYDVGYQAHQAYIVTELLTGGTLSTLLDQGPLPFSRSAELVAKVAHSVHAAHLKGLVHRDIKPGNIVIDESGEPRLADFGLAITEDEQMRESAGTSGTLPYMSPEQVSGQVRLIGPQSDTYSLGVVLYRCLTGRLPFQTGDPEELKQQILNKEPWPPRTINDRIPVELEEICLRCLQKPVAARYRTALDLAIELEMWLERSDAPSKGYLAPLPLPAPAASAVPPRRSIFASPMGAWAAAIVAGASILGAALIIDGIRDGLNSSGTATNSGTMTPGVAVVSESGHPRRPEPVLLPVSHRVRIPTDPPADVVVIWPLDKRHGLPDPEGRIEPTRSKDADTSNVMEVLLPPGDYLVVAAIAPGQPDQSFQEVFRHVPENPWSIPSSGNHHSWSELASGGLEWPTIEIRQDQDIGVSDMSPFSGAAAFSMGLRNDASVPLHHRRVPPFLLDTIEVTWGDVIAARLKTLPLAPDGRPPALDETTLLSVLPPSQHHLKLQDIPPLNLPISSIWWDDAVSLAEQMGKRLPTEAEYEFAATNGGTTQFPWGNDGTKTLPWTFGPAGEPLEDHTSGELPVYGLYSNVVEWTSSYAAPYPPYWGRKLWVPRRADHYIVRGGPAQAIYQSAELTHAASGPRQRSALDKMYRPAPGLGFRCARSARPRLTAQDLETYGSAKEAMSED